MSMKSRAARLKAVPFGSLPSWTSAGVFQRKIADAFGEVTGCRFGDDAAGNAGPDHFEDGGGVLRFK